MKTIINLNSAELSQICGGVIEGPDGKGCTEHDLPGQDDDDVIELDFGGVTIEIDPSI